MPDSDILVAKESFFATEHNTMVQKGERVRDGHPILEGRAHLFERADTRVSFDVEQATAAPGEKRGKPTPEPAVPAPAAPPATPGGRYDGIRQQELLADLAARGIEVPRQRGTVANKTLVDLLEADDAKSAAAE